MSRIPIIGGNWKMHRGTPNDAKEMLKELKFRVENPGAVIKTLIKLSKFAVKFPKIKELDINPLIVNKNEAIVVDARAVK